MYRYGRSGSLPYRPSYARGSSGGYKFLLNFKATLAGTYADYSTQRRYR